MLTQRHHHVLIDELFSNKITSIEKYPKSVFAAELFLFCSILRIIPAQLSLFPPHLLSSCLTQLFHSASGVDPLILAWQRGEDTDGTLLNLICKSKMCLCFSSAFSRLSLAHLDLSISPSPQTPDRFKCECANAVLPHWGLLWDLNCFWCSESSFSVCMLKNKSSLND